MCLRGFGTALYDGFPDDCNIFIPSISLMYLSYWCLDCLIALVLIYVYIFCYAIYFLGISVYLDLGDYECVELHFPYVHAGNSTVCSVRSRYKVLDLNIFLNFELFY